MSHRTPELISVLPCAVGQWEVPGKVGSTLLQRGGLQRARALEGFLQNRGTWSTGPWGCVALAWHTGFISMSLGEWSVCVEAGAGLSICPWPRTSCHASGRTPRSPMRSVHRRGDGLQAILALCSGFSSCTLVRRRSWNTRPSSSSTSAGRLHEELASHSPRPKPGLLALPSQAPQRALCFYQLSHSFP